MIHRGATREARGICICFHTGEQVGNLPYCEGRKGYRVGVDRNSQNNQEQKLLMNKEL